MYFEDGVIYIYGYDFLINGLVVKYLGDKVFIFNDFRKYFLGRWFILRELRKINKIVVIVGFGD